MTIYLDPLDPEGMDCDTCGWSSDDAQIDYEGGGVWRLEGRWGCYGGDQFEGRLDELIAYLRDGFLGTHLFTPASLKRAIRDLEAVGGEEE